MFVSRLQSELVMKSLPTYDIPMEFIEAEFQKNDDSPTLKDYRNRQSEIRNNAYDYINGYKAMVFMEEAADMQYLSKFKHVDIQLSFDKETECFFFAYEVNLTQFWRQRHGAKTTTLTQRI